MRLDLSNRKYFITIAGRGYTLEAEMDLADLFQNGRDNTPEYVYAIQDIVDDVLDLKVEEHIKFKPSRDEDLSVGIIWRIK